MAEMTIESEDGNTIIELCDPEPVTPDLIIDQERIITNEERRAGASGYSTDRENPMLHWDYYISDGSGDFREGLRWGLLVKDGMITARVTEFF